MISLLFGVPIRVTLADKTYRVRQYRLIDLAKLEAWVLSRVEVPSVLIEMALSSEDSEERSDWLRKASDVANQAPIYGSDEVRAHLTTPEGTAYQLQLGIILPKRKRLSFRNAEALARKLTLADWFRFSRVAYGLHPLDEVSSLIDLEIGAPPMEGHTMSYRDWRQSIRLCMEAGISPHVISKLPIRLWDSAIHGKDGAHPIAEPEDPDPDYWNDISKVRGEFWKGWNVSTNEMETEL